MQLNTTTFLLDFHCFLAKMLHKYGPLVGYDLVTLLPHVIVNTWGHEVKVIRKGLHTLSKLKFFLHFFVFCVPNLSNQFLHAACTTRTIFKACISQNQSIRVYNIHNFELPQACRQINLSEHIIYQLISLVKYLTCHNN